MSYISVARGELNAIGYRVATAVPSILIALAVLVVTWLAAKLAARVTERLLAKADLRENLRQLTRTVVRLGVWVIGLLIAATILVPGFTPASLIASLGLGAVAIGFAFQDIFENFLAGVLIMLRKKMRIGDMIETQGILGKVELVSLRETHIRQYSGELTILPNSMIFKNPVKIFSDQHERRNEIVIGVAYDTDLDRAAGVIRKAVEGLPGITESHGVDVYAQEFNSSSIDFLVRWWTDTTANDFLRVKSEAIFAIKRALDDAEIEIPFPYVTHTFKEPLPYAGPR